VPKFKVSEGFWKAFYALPPAQKEKVRKAWEKFKVNPKDPSLGIHKINRLSSLKGTTVRAAEIEGNLRIIFIVQADTIYTVSIGTHDIYKG
jgi:hypothetical protein